MPFFLDIYDFTGNFTALLAAQMHLNDIKVQHLYNCQKICYWFDAKQCISFGLVEADNAENIQEMHRHNHIQITHRIVQVEPEILSTFLDELEAPFKKYQLGNGLVPEAALTTIMASSIDVKDYRYFSLKELRKRQKIYVKLAHELIERFNGNIISKNNSSFLVAFHSGKAALNCAQKIFKRYNSLSYQENNAMFLKTGLSGCGLLANKPGAYVETIKLAKRICFLSQTKILITHEVLDSFHNEGIKLPGESALVKSINSEEIRFITLLMNYMDSNWKNQNLQSLDLIAGLDCSKSHLYRRMMDLLGQSPVTFIKKYRLIRARDFLKKGNGKISEIAFDTGFNSSSYFSKCFQSEFGITPSQYLQAF